MTLSTYIHLIAHNSYMLLFQTAVHQMDEEPLRNHL